MGPFAEINRPDLAILMDPERPHWFAGNDKAKLLFQQWHAGHDETELIADYQKRYQTDAAKSFLFVRDFLAKLERIQFLDRQRPNPYTGRADYLKLHQLQELWLHTNNSCNIACKHCLVSSSPKEDPGQPTETLLQWIDQGLSLGVERFYFTGGEPFYRRDILKLIEQITVTHGKELIIISNGMLFDDEMIRSLAKIPQDRLRIQISLDGASAKTNDAIRTRGNFDQALAGLKKLSRLPLEKIITTVVHPANLDELAQMPKLAKELGVDTLHLMWPHLRGRFAQESTWKEQVHSLTQRVAQVLESARDEGVFLDNYESVKWKINGKPDVKFDLAGAGWESLCIYSDGTLYPSAAFANTPALACGSLKTTSLEKIWRDSAVLHQLRQASVIHNPRVQSDPYRYFVGGGDVEHAFFFSHNGEVGQFSAPDPYYPLYQYFAEEALVEIAEQRRQQTLVKNGFDGPMIYHAMGDGAIDTVPEAREVATLHSNCVLGFDVEKPRLAVQRFYGQAAEKPQAELCCPIRFDPSEIAHIPQAVIERFYGCGSPVLAADVKQGETFLDLGSGAGIDCFIAAKKVGASGKAIGVDMTGRMLAVAAENKPLVAKNLGYDVVEFREGFLEQIPVENKQIDVITSNCVINLSPDKKAVFASMWRCLKNGGRAVISDIISEAKVPLHMRLNPVLWGECLSGSLTQEELFSHLEDTGFYGLQVLDKKFWKEVEGCRFYSITFRAFKYEKQSGCQFIGQKAIYLGPFKGIADEEGHYFPRNQAVEICTDTFNKLGVEPIKSSFVLITPDGQEEYGKCCAPEGSCC